MLSNKQAALIAPLALFALILCTLNGCQASRLGDPDVKSQPGNDAGQVQEPSGEPQGIAAMLPSPSALLALYEEQAGSKLASYTESDLIRHGADYTNYFPHKNLSDDGNILEFHPSWSDTTGKTEGNLSYCVYTYTVEGYDRTPRIRYGWSDPPEDFSTVWLGLANWGADRWDWRQAEEDGTTNLASMEPYIQPSAHHVFIYMVHASMDVSALRYIGLGPRQVEAVLTAAPKYSLPPVSATASTAASTTAVGSIAKHEFDWDGDGVFEVDQGTVGASVHDVSETGSYAVSARVTNSYGEQDTASDSYQVVGTWQHTWGLPEIDCLYAVTTDDTEYCYAAGSLESSSKGLQIVVLKYRLDGELQWVRAWGDTEDDCAMDIQFYFDSLYIAGYTENFGAGEKDVLLQRWDTDGNVAWTRTWGGTSVDTGTGIAVTPNGVYVCGEERVSGTGGNDALLLKYNHDGALQWEKSWAGDDSDIAEDVLSTYNIITDSYYLNLTGRTDDWGGINLVLYLQFNEGGALTIQKAWEATSGTPNQSGHAIASYGYPPTLYIAGDTGYSEELSSLLLEVGSGTTATAVSWGDIRRDHAYGLVAKGDHILVCGETEFFEDTYGAFLVDISPSGGYQGSRTWQAGIDSYFYGIVSFPGTGVLLAGAGASADLGNWHTWTATLTPRDGTWNNLSGTVQSPTGVTASPILESVIVTNGVEDIGDGFGYIDECALVSFGLP
jgi:hypothetical protein